jgi:biofilm PGA synthesis N-glycosyltransferase PgaC
MNVCVLVALAALGYTYLGYPALLRVLIQLAGRGRSGAAGSEPAVVSGDERAPSVSVLMPAFNAAAYLPAKLESLLEQAYPPDLIEILIYCDGCTDDTEAVARAFAESAGAGGRVRVFGDPAQRGKPTGLNTLAAAATGDLLLLNDVRQPLSKNAIRDLTRAFTDPAVGVATGRLVLAGGAGSGVYWRYEEWIRRHESRFRGVFGMTGPLGMVRRADFIPVPTDIILDDVWLPMSLVLAGKRVVLVPTAEAHDTAFTDEREFSRKVRTLAGNYQLFAKLPQLLVPFINPIWFETFSHKLMRLCAPWMLLLLLGSSLVAATGGGAGLVRALVVAQLLAQLLFYGMAAVGTKGGRLTGVARTFVVLNVAAIVGLGRFLTGRQRITWKTGRESGSAAASERAAPEVQVSSGPTKS